MVFVARQRRDLRFMNANRGIDVGSKIKGHFSAKNRPLLQNATLERTKKVAAALPKGTQRAKAAAKGTPSGPRRTKDELKKLKAGTKDKRPEDNFKERPP